jgi:glycosyltransferase involved in cell wall biosynthesis
MKERGYEIRLISLGGEPIPGIDTFCLPRRGRLSYLLQAGKAARLAREFKPDLVHVHYAGGYGYWGSKCDFAPVLVSVWGADVIDLPTNPVQRHFIRRTLRRADAICATSEFLRTASVRLAPETAEKTTVIPFGVNLPEEITPPPEPPVKLCFIKVHRRKYGPDLLLKAFARALDETPDLRLTMAGNGPMTESLKELSAQLGIDDVVDFVGFIPNNEIYPLLKSHHIMVMPSVMESESFGVAVLEASACGRPVIASRVGGVPEVLIDGETGLLVPPGDVDSLTAAIVRLAEDPLTCLRMGQAGYQMVDENYRWERSLDMMSAQYEALTHG